MSKQNNLKDYLTDLYEGISTKRPNASRNPQNFRAEIESIEGEKAKLQEKTLTANGVYPPDSGYDGFSKVTVDVAGKVLPKYDGEVIIEGEPESGGGGGGSAEFNIAYGDTAPSDTTKLWVKANEPEAVSVTSSPVFEAGEIEAFAQTLPTAAGGIASALVGTKVYLFGGVGENLLSAINVFDTESKTITTLSATLPKAAYNIAAAAVGTKVYLFGGGAAYSSRVDTINVFDTENNSIETLNVTLPSATSGIASAVVGKMVYLFGGYAGSASKAIYVFDTENNTISALSTNLPGTAYNIAPAVVGTKVYLFGGQRSDQLNFSTIDVFDTENNTIETLSATLPKAAYNIASAVAGTKVYLFGGYNYSSYYRSTIYVFDTKDNSISTLSTTLTIAASDIASVLVGAKVYLFGGQKNGGYLNTVDVFNISMPLASNTMIIEATKSKNIFNLFSNVEIGIEAVYLGNADGNGERVDAYLHNGTEWVEV